MTTSSWHSQGYASTTRIVAAAAVSGLFLAGCGGGDPGTSGSAATETGEEQEAVELRFTSALPEGGVNEQTEWWAKELESRTDGAIQVERFYDASLMGAVEVLEAVNDGRVKSGNFAPSYWPAEFPLLNISSIPFQTEDSGAFLQALRDLLEVDAIQEELARNNVEIVMWYPHAPGASGTVEPVSSLEDFAGKRLRVTGDVAAAFEMIGAEPVAQDPAETYEAIQRGVLDGFGSLLFDLVPLLGLHEVAPHVLDAGTGLYAAGGIMVQKDFMDSLPDDQAELIRSVASEAMDEHAISTLEELEAAACDEILDSGGNVTLLPESEVDEWKGLVGDSIVQDWRERAIESGVSEDDVDSVYEVWTQSLASNTPSGYEHGMKKCAERSS